MKKSGSAHASAGATKTAIVVAGMHRSGTSAVARTLNLLGCSLPQNLLPASRNDNELGFWESKPIMELNNEILASAGSAWDDWTPFNRDWFASPPCEDFSEKALAVLESEFGDSRMFVVKDPRICRLFPFWLERLREFGAKTYVVSPIRNPLEVAESLNKRNKVNLSYARLFWLRHVLDAEAHSRQLPRVFVRYEDLLSGWGRVTERIASALDISWPRQSSTAEMEIEEYLSPGQRHNFETAQAVLENSNLSVWVRNVFEILDRWARDESRPTDIDELDRIRNAFDDATPAFARLVLDGCAAERSKRALEKQLSDRDRTVADLTAKLESERSLTAGSEKTKQESAQLRAKLAETESALAQRRLEADQMREAASKANAEARELEMQARSQNAEIAALSAILKEKSVAAGQASAAARELEARLQNQSAEISALSAMLKEKAAAANEAKASVDDLSRRVQARDAEVTALTAMLREKNSAANQAKASVDDLSRRVQAGSAEVTALTALLKEKNAAANQAKASAQELEAALRTRSAELATLTQMLRDKDQAAFFLDRVLDKTIGENGWPLLPARLRLAQKVAAMRRLGIFDEKWYLAQYEDVASNEAARVDPLRHFVAFGWKEGRAPNAAIAASRRKNNR